MASKTELVKRALDLGLGTKEFLEKVQVENLESMIALVEGKDAKIAEATSAPAKNPKVTTVADIVKKGSLKVVGGAKAVDEKDIIRKEEA